MRKKKRQKPWTLIVSPFMLIIFLDVDLSGICWKLCFPYKRYVVRQFFCFNISVEFAKYIYDVDFLASVFIYLTHLLFNVRYSNFILTFQLNFFRFAKNKIQLGIPQQAPFFYQNGTTTRENKINCQLSLLKFQFKSSLNNFDDEVFFWQWNKMTTKYSYLYVSDMVELIAIFSSNHSILRLTIFYSCPFELTCYNGSL